MRKLIALARPALAVAGGVAFASIKKPVPATPTAAAPTADRPRSRKTRRRRIAARAKKPGVWRRGHPDS